MLYFEAPYNTIYLPDGVMDMGKETIESGNSSNRSALLVIDVQRGIFEKSTPVYRAEELLSNIGILADRAREAGAPVFYVQHSDKLGLKRGSKEWELHPRLAPLPADSIVHKLRPNAFDGTGLDGILKSKNVGRVVVAGLVSHGCVKATCLGAKKLGYEVILASDAHSSYSKDAVKHFEETNERLESEKVKLARTNEVVFG
jgi:nicotinamidase-related amidase